ncbi:helix-turn-helix transcriptional regulator [Nocardioides speluncae]|uniref:helix-turn-helix transcriptional regulator n=1 Tax=Nocardioides speluncae TaxID=2670337 RepID=UPI00137A2E96|nr:helix-turn-helix transcriptional regulator [Nocardioides speluncae]
MSRLVSPLFAGREEELAGLLAAHEASADGTPKITLIGAEAGGGKSRLVREFTARVRGSARILQGSCLELSEAGLPYAPFAAALRDVVREYGADGVAGLVDEYAARELARLLPTLGVPADDAEPQLAKARLFEALLRLLERLAEERPVVLVVEDLHWADAGTRDLVAFLVPNLCSTRVQLVTTYRTEDLADGHPLRAMLGRVERLGGVTHAVLARLNRDQVAAQLEGMLGRPADPSVVNEVLARGGGVPLFTESLVDADGSLRTELPTSLRDLMLQVVGELPDAAQQVVRAAAVGGTRVSHPLLARVTGLPDAELNAALRAAVGGQVLSRDPGGYAFRHQLIRAAVEDDLLAGESAGLHRAYAEALTEDPGLEPDDLWAPVGLALHWHGAREPERALTAAWTAAAEAARQLAYPEQVRMLDQVLALWPVAPDAAAAIGVDRGTVLEAAADAACWAADTTRGLELVEEGLRELGPDGDPETRARLLLERAYVRLQVMLPGELDDLREAVEVAAKPTVVRAEALGQLARTLIRRDECAQARPLATEELALAEQIGEPEYAVEAQVVLARIDARQGRDVLPALAETVRRARGLDLGGLELMAYAALVEAHTATGAHAAAITTGHEGLRRTAQLGLARFGAANIAQGLAEALTAEGRWDDALAVVDDALALDPTAFGRAQLLVFRGRIAIDRGEVEAAIRVADELRQLIGETPSPFVLPLAELDIELALAAGDPAGASAALTDAVGDRLVMASPRYAWPLLCIAARAAVDAGDTAALDRLGSIAGDAERPGPVAAAYAASFAAEVSRAAGANPALWDEAAAAWTAPHPRAYALMRAGAAYAALGDREAAGDRLREAAALAEPLRAEPLLDQLNLLARRVRVELGAGARAHSEAARVPFQLTERELEVLALVAAGRSNREIAGELFISAKTASVHVSNILAKLGVASRGEAAATAHRLHLFEPA